MTISDCHAMTSASFSLTDTSRYTINTCSHAYHKTQKFVQHIYGFTKLKRLIRVITENKQLIHPLFQLFSRLFPQTAGSSASKAWQASYICASTRKASCELGLVFINDVILVIVIIFDIISSNHAYFMQFQARDFGP